MAESQHHLSFKQRIAETIDGIDWRSRKIKSLGKGYAAVVAKQGYLVLGRADIECLQELQYPEAIDAFLTGVYKQVPCFEVLAERLPQLICLQLLAQEVAHRCLYLFVVQTREQSKRFGDRAETFCGI